MKAQNITIAKTAVFFNPLDPRYPGMPATVKGHLITFNDIEELIGLFIQMWQLDPSTGYFRMLGSSSMFLSSNQLFMAIDLLAMPQGKLCILAAPFTAHLEYKAGGLVPAGTAYNGTTMKWVSDAIKSNVFTYQIGDQDITGGSVNSGPAPYPFSLGEAIQAGQYPAATPPPPPTPSSTGTGRGKKKVQP